VDSKLKVVPGVAQEADNQQRGRAVNKLLYDLLERREGLAY
jgi:hypothetical protein